MKDIFGTTIEVGDTVAFNIPTYRSLTTGEVIGLTPKRVRIKYTYQGSEKETLEDPQDLAVKPILV